MLSTTMCLAFALGLQAAEGACSDPTYSWQKLEAAFQKARAPSKKELAGKWLLTVFVMTREFRGGNEKDSVQVDCTGITRNADFEWVLKFSITAENRLVVNSIEMGDLSQNRQIDFEPDGSMILEQNDAGDAMTVYRCRMTNPRTLLCVYSDAPGYGVEFRKQQK